MTDFPSAHYPSFAPPREKGSEVPDSFGCFHSCNIQHGDQDLRPEFHFQYSTKNSLKQRLNPVGQCVPFLPPNEGVEVCPASYHDYVRKAGKYSLSVNVEQQAEYFHRHYPELTYGPLLEVLSQDELSAIHQAPESLVSKREKQRTGGLKHKNALSRVVDGISAAGVSRPLLHGYLEEELNSVLQKMYHDESFYGGCLSYEWFPPKIHKKHGHAGLLFYPSGTVLDTVNIHALEVDPSGPVPTFKPTLTQYQFNVSGPVRQIQSHRSPFQDTILTGIRTDYRCYILKSDVKNRKLKCKLMHDVNSQHCITSLSLSPHINGEFVFTCESGEAHLVDAKTKIIAQSGVHLSPSTGQAVPIYSHFGAHPRQLVTHCRQQFYQLDFRISNQNGPEEIPLFTLPNPSLPKDQYFCVAKQHPSNHFYHFLATQHYMMIVDARFPGYSVLQWPHQLSSPPSCISVAPYLSSPSSMMEDLLLVSSYSSRETHCFQYSSLLGNTPQATNVPWKIQDYDAWLYSMSDLPSRHTTALRKRLQQPLVGMCAAKLDSNQESSVTVFEISAAGDIFHQVLSVRDCDEANSNLNRMKLDHVSDKQCQEFVERVLEQHLETNDTDIIASERINCKRQWKKMVRDVAPLQGCSLCRHGNIGPDSTPDKENSVCDGCGLPLGDSHTLFQSHGDSSILTASKLADYSDGRGKRIQQLVTKTVTAKMARCALSRRLWNSWDKNRSEIEVQQTPNITRKKKKVPPSNKSRARVKMKKLPLTNEEIEALASPERHLNVNTGEEDYHRMSLTDQGSSLTVATSLFPKSVSTPVKRPLKRKAQHTMGF